MRELIDEELEHEGPPGLRDSDDEGSEDESEATCTPGRLVAEDESPEQPEKETEGELLEKGVRVRERSSELPPSGLVAPR